MATSRLLISRVVVGKRMLGNIMIKTTIGRPISVGVMNEANRFSFIYSLKGLCFLWIWLFLALG